MGLVFQSWVAKSPKTPKKTRCFLAKKTTNPRLTVFFFSGPPFFSGPRCWCNEISDPEKLASAAGGGLMLKYTQVVSCHGDFPNMWRKEISPELWTQILMSKFVWVRHAMLQLIFQTYQIYSNLLSRWITALSLQRILPNFDLAFWQIDS